MGILYKYSRSQKLNSSYFRNTQTRRKNKGYFEFSGVCVDVCLYDMFCTWKQILLRREDKEEQEEIIVKLKKLRKFKKTGEEGKQEERKKIC